MSAIVATAPSPFQFLTSVAPQDTAKAAPDGPDFASMASQFDAWRDSAPVEKMSTDYVSRIDDARETFIAVTERARTENGFDDPQAFVQSLSADERAALQAVHGLANPIDPSSLSREGAHNLLMMRGQEQDLDHDGLTEIGAGKSIVFPPRDAPQSVKDAWESATAGLDDFTSAAMSLSGWIGARGGSFATGTADYAQPDFDWQDFARQMIGGLQENLKYQAKPGQQANVLAQIDAFRDFLSKLG